VENVKKQTVKDVYLIFIKYPSKMKSYYFLLLATFLSTFTIYGQEDNTTNFPFDFFGIYTGTLEISSKNGFRTIPMEFHLQPTDSVGKYEYKLVYIVDNQRQERPYYLIESNKEAGEYIVDEDNGIILDDKVIDNRMDALFEVGDNLLTTFITFEKNAMIFEIVVTNKTEKRITYTDDEDKTQVISYPITTIQRAVLQKQ